jgi:ABC-type bacteriocin/lantibiotic exporter with double-glycine peptidase domain
LAFSIFLFEVNGANNLTILPLLGTFAFAAYKAQPALSSVIYGINSIEYGAKIILNLNSNLKKNSSKLKNKSHRYEDLGSKNKNSIIIKGLSYFYKKERNINFLNNINLEIKYNSLFLIIGESGSGKSTLLNLISCLIKPTKGEITFNTNRSIGKKPKISYLHQNHYLYNTSIAKNIAFGVPENFIDYERVKKVLKKTEIYNYVYKLKNNIHENVGENGSKLSTGQIQRIALARALYFEPEILILDEPTSALDKKNELGILKTLIKISQEITVIMSTHKTFNLLDLSDVSFIDLSRSND